MKCKKCVIVRTRLLARSMVALGFSLDDITKSVTKPLQDVGYNVQRVKDVVRRTDELVAMRFGPAEADLYDSYVLCRSDGR